MSVLSSAWRLIKENPWKFFLGSFSAVFLTLVGMLYSDINFAHRDDVEQFIESTNQTIQDLKKKVEDLTDALGD